VVELSETHREIQRSVREFVKSKVEPLANTLDSREAPLPDEWIRAMGELGYLGLTVPESYGGAGLDALAMALVTEELARGWLCVASVMTRAIISSSMILAHGTEAQKKAWLPRLCSGEMLSAAAFTEPAAGSDLASVSLRADRDGDGYVLRGEKTWCTFADRAHVLTVLARTSGAKHEGLSLFFVEKEPSLSFSPHVSASPIPTIGYKGVTSYALSFDGLRVPSQALLGGVEGKGFRQLMSSFEYARIQTAARAVGVAQASLDAAIGYAKERVQFGVPIAQHQVIRHKIAKMATDVEAARQLCRFAARAKDEGRRCDLEAGYAKAFAAEMAERTTTEAMQVFGGYGYSKEYDVQRYWRDARVFRIFEGTSEIQYEVIAKRLLDGGLA
jgi:(2S)-methylsuccinyl-CoA dehydrogenase